MRDEKGVHRAKLPLYVYLRTILKVLVAQVNVPNGDLQVVDNLCDELLGERRALLGVILGGGRDRERKTLR